MASPAPVARRPDAAALTPGGWRLALLAPGKASGGACDGVYQRPARRWHTVAVAQRFARESWRIHDVQAGWIDRAQIVYREGRFMGHNRGRSFSPIVGTARKRRIPGQCWPGMSWFGAGDGIRTRDPLLGKQLRYHCATPAWSAGYTIPDSGAAPQVAPSARPPGARRRFRAGCGELGYRMKRCRRDRSPPK
jgi:hypothetical protein